MVGKGENGGGRSYPLFAFVLLHVVVCFGTAAAESEYYLSNVTCTTDCNALCTVERAGTCKPKCCTKNCGICSNDGCIECVTCGKYQCGEQCTPNVVDEVCASRCEVKKWLQCSTGFGGCDFHDTNDHYKRAIEKLHTLQQYGLSEDQCTSSLVEGKIPDELCVDCQSLFRSAIADMSLAAHISTYQDKGIIWTPKEAMLHLRRCACMSSPENAGASYASPYVRKFSGINEDTSLPLNGDSCFWFAWFEGISGGGAAYSVSSSTENFQKVLEEYGNKGYSLVSSAFSHGQWMGWWEILTSKSKWIMRSSTDAFIEELENQKRNGYVPTSLAYGDGMWLAWLWQDSNANAGKLVATSTLHGLVTEMNSAISSGRKLQSSAYGGDGVWISSFSPKSSNADSSWIITPSFGELSSHSNQMIGEGRFASAITYGKSVWLGWYDANPNTPSAYALNSTDAGFVDLLNANLKGPNMMVTSMAYGCEGH
eukprot:CAMPEP_0198234692 /NCGR_PEP_ID=MMETSP1446-20131203/647_1 /TAXON_ID=1461542 ORGANISM="Unidentified sp, Strain CCMP2111" /NCGR_SAMPLE_ID=MMETSP1446 /ASSEMBLY_ACC=CAM_ASM_001112 /LENGTH=481 /DNA_ID=CAMNT_0043915513 /DNA_START=185 /DNA_END=1630 /DNA_ORIENTATION=+